MILYYAAGGGLGHVTRGCRVLETLRLTDRAAIVTSSPDAHHARIAGGIPILDIPAELDGNPAGHRAWLEALIRARHADRLIADTFPGGIQGELCGLDLPMDHVVRLLRWDEYRRCVPGELPRFGTAWTVEELTPEHDAFVHAHSDRVAALALTPQRFPDVRREPFWLIVHSGPEEEVRELVAYTAELLTLAADRPSQVLVASRCAVDLPGGFAHADASPAAALFPAATRIISAAGFNVMLETEPYRDKHEVVPFARRFDDQYARASRRRNAS